MHQKHLAGARTRWGSLKRFPRSPSWILGVWVEIKEGEGKGQDGEKGVTTEGRERGTAGEERQEGVEEGEMNGESRPHCRQLWMMSDPVREEKSRRTWDTSVDDPEELLVPARITEERRVNCHRAARLASTGAVQREMYVDVTVAGVRDITLGRHQRVIASVAGTVEDYQLVRGTDDLQNRVETDEFVETAVGRPRQRPHCFCISHITR